MVSDTYNFAGKKILIAEDEETNYFYLETVLKRTGAILFRARNGEEAVKVCEDQPSLDLVLMDIKMPDLNGLDATRLIRKFNATLPIIAQTAYALVGERNKCLSAGCNDYISKPINRESLLKMITSFLG
jgi:two-component system cell cycle response regulator DivK